LTGLSPAEQLLAGLGIDDPSQIDVEAIAWERGAEVRYAALDSCEARIIGYGDRAIITVSEASGWRRKRFSVAHELGHWKWHRGRSFVCRSADIGAVGLASDLNPERVADQYAADLLLPGYLFRPKAGRIRRLCFEEIDALRERFRTSRTSTAIQAVRTSGHPALLVCHGREGRRWFVRAPGVPERWFPREDLDADSCAIDVVFGTTERTRMQLAGAEAWFDRRGAEEYEVYEQAVRTVDGGALCLVVVNSAGMLS
jgi:hypothetical protein